MSTLSLLVSSLFSICLSVTPLSNWKSGGQASKHLYKNQAVMTACGYQNVASYLNGVSPHPSHNSLFPFGYVTAVGTVSAGSQYDNLFNDGYGCGACYEVKCTGIWGNAQAGCYCHSDSVIVQAIDLSGNNPEPHFDIAFDGFGKIAGSLCGRVAIDYRQVACEFSNNIYITTDNNDAWSYYLNFYNVAGDGKLCKVEMKSGSGGSGNWNVCENRKSKWMCDEAPRSYLPLSFRLTDCAGNSIIATDAVNAYGSISANLGVNFPVTSTPTPPTPTPPPVTGPSTPTPPSGDCTGTTRCGADWGDANGKCGPCCSSNGDCTSAQPLCYADLSAQPCSGNQPPPTPPPVTPTPPPVTPTPPPVTPTPPPVTPTPPPVTPTPPPVTRPTTPTPPSGGCTGTTRCGANWGDANGKCGPCCSSNNDCTSAQPLCYADLSAQPCSGNSNQPTPTPPPVTPTPPPVSSGGSSGGAWSSRSSGGMAGVTYASGTIYNVGTMCPSNVNQGYVCDGRNFGDKYLDSSKMSSFCSGHTGKQYGFGHGLTSSQKCGECAQIRVPRTDGSYNYMTVMMVDHYTSSMEVGTTEIAYLVEGTNWVVGDRADFDFRIVGNYDCYASFGGSNNGGGSTQTTTTTTTTTTTNSGGGNNGGNNGGSCGVSNNWGSMKINPYWGSSRSSLFAMISNPPASITSFAIRGANQNDNQYQTCVYQTQNGFQCILSSPLTEPASVKLNNGAYYGTNIIESMTGSLKKYPLAACSSPFKSVENDNKSGVNWTVWFAIILCALGVVIIAVVIWVCVYKKRMYKGKGYVTETDNIKLRENDGNNTTEKVTTEMITLPDNTNGNESESGEAEIEIEIELIEAEIETL